MDQLVRSWWTQAVRGAAGLGLLLACAVWSGMPTEALRVVFGSYLFVCGVISLSAAFMRAWALLLDGLWDLAFAFLLAAWPLGPAATAYAIAYWAIGDGILELWAAAGLRRRIPGELILGTAAVISLGFGVILGALTRAGDLRSMLPIAMFGFLSATAYLQLAAELHAHLPGRQRRAPIEGMDDEWP
jgi:uncharacterized membrane protein HdeD (DUF308 family)